MKTFTAIVLNIVYPGAGYLYLKDAFRRQIAIFLASIWTLFLGGVAYYFVKALITNDSYLFTEPIEIPFLAYAMWIFMCVDTYLLAKNQKINQPHRKAKSSSANR